MAAGPGQQGAAHRVVIAGGGVAGLEALLALGAIAHDRVELTLLCPNEDFVYRPRAVEAPFAGRGAGRYPLAPAVAETGARWVRDSLRSVDTQNQIASTSDGQSLGFDSLLLAIGAQLSPAFSGVTVFDDAHSDQLLHGLVQDVEGGYSTSIAFVLPKGPTWPLPLYELALMTAERAHSMGVDPALHFVTPEPRPLAVLGDEASEHVASLLARARIHVHTSANPIARKGEVLLDHTQAHPEILRAERIVTLPYLAGRSVPGIPEEDGFVGIDEYCRVLATENVYAAGDITSFPIKHGGLGCQQADVAAEQIAATAGADVTPTPLAPVLRAKLLTGGAPTYLTAELIGSSGFRSTVSEDPSWESGAKIAARYLAPYLDRVDERQPTNT